MKEELLNILNELTDEHMGGVNIEDYADKIETLFLHDTIDRMNKILLQKGHCTAALELYIDHLENQLLCKK